MGLDFELVVEGLGWSLKNGLKMQDLPKEIEGLKRNFRKSIDIIQNIAHIKFIKLVEIMKIMLQILNSKNPKKPILIIKSLICQIDLWLSEVGGVDYWI